MRRALVVLKPQYLAASRVVRKRLDVPGCEPLTNHFQSGWVADRCCGLHRYYSVWRRLIPCRLCFGVGELHEWSGSRRVRCYIGTGIEAVRSVGDEMWEGRWS